MRIVSAVGDAGAGAEAGANAVVVLALKITSNIVEVAASGITYAVWNSKTGVGQAEIFWASSVLWKSTHC